LGRPGELAPLCEGCATQAQTSTLRPISESVDVFRDELRAKKRTTYKIRIENFCAMEECKPPIVFEMSDGATKLGSGR